MENLKKVFVVDDSSLFKHLIGNIVNETPNVKLVGFASNGKEAIDKIGILKPDIVTLDVEMPIMNGIEALGIINKKWPNIKVIMVTSMNQYSIERTINALESNAFSFVTKPDIGGEKHIKTELTRIFTGITAESSFESPIKPTSIHKSSVVKVTHSRSKPSIVGIGVSTGGPNALVHVIPKLPADLAVPVVVVQHMPEGFTKPLAESLDKKSKVKVKEGENGEVLKAGVVYFAPGGKHMKVVPHIASKFGKIEITDDAPENFCKPSVDYLFRSLSSTFKDRVVAVIMTGMGNDGTKGLKLLKRQGNFSIGQNKESCVVYGMPGSAMNAGIIDKEVHLDEIAKEIETAVKTGV